MLSTAAGKTAATKQNGRKKVMTTKKRHLPRQSLTREQIQKMTDEDLVARLSEREKQDTLGMTRLTFDGTPPKKRADESGGEYKKRLRESKTVDKEEFARALRASLEQTLFASEDQTSRRLMDTLTADATPESIKEQEAKDAAREERENRREMDSDISVRPEGYGGASAEWEED